MAEIRREIGPQNTCFREAAWTKAWEHRLEMRRTWVRTLTGCGSDEIRQAGRQGQAYDAK